MGKKGAGGGPQTPPHVDVDACARDYRASELSEHGYHAWCRAHAAQVEETEWPWTTYIILGAWVGLLLAAWLA